MNKNMNIEFELNEEIIDAFCKLYGYLPTVKTIKLIEGETEEDNIEEVVEIENPQSKEDFSKEKIKTHLSDFLRNTLLDNFKKTTEEEARKKLLDEPFSIKID